MSNVWYRRAWGLGNMNLNSGEVKEMNEIECDKDMHRRHRIS